MEIYEAKIEDYPTVQNMAKFYVYEMSRSCGKSSKSWKIPNTGMYECFDFKKYFVNADRKAYLIKVQGELAGFVLLHQSSLLRQSEWNIGEFFIIARFQGSGLGQRVAFAIWKMQKGFWKFYVHPENTPALAFWRKVVSAFSKDQFTEEILPVDFDKECPKRYVFSFTS